MHCNGYLSLFNTVFNYLWVVTTITTCRRMYIMCATKVGNGRYHTYVRLGARFQWVRTLNLDQIMSRFTQPSQDDSSYILVARMDNARNLSSILKAVNFREVTVGMVLTLDNEYYCITSYRTLQYSHWSSSAYIHFILICVARLKR